MGYTHYWKKTARIDDATWIKIITDVKELYGNMPTHSDNAGGGYYSDTTLALGGCFSYEKPQFGKKQILFNGSNGNKRVKKNNEWQDDDDSRDFNHETFLLNQEAEDFTFCKTASKPYDLMVCASLIVAKHHSESFSFSSDGVVKDWTPAIDFVKDVLGYTVDVEGQLEE